MIALSYAISKVIVDEYGKHEFLKRLADPLWFQAFGCVLGFDTKIDAFQCLQNLIE